MGHDETLRNRRNKLIETHVLIAEALRDKFFTDDDQPPPDIEENVHVPMEDYLLLLELALYGHATFEASNSTLN